MQFYVGVTDPGWFQFHSSSQSEEVNFWQPKSPKALRVIETGSPFLFKLRRPHNHIAGIGFYVTHSILPLSMAWKTFGVQNGADSYEAFKQKINTIRGTREMDPVIGCLVLTDPVYFPENDWLDVGAIWPKNVVQGKSYNTQQREGQWLWNQVQSRLEKYQWLQRENAKDNELVAKEPEEAYSQVLKKVRLGQGGFRSLVLNAYQQRCAMTGEKTLPALEAAHIKEHTSSGPYRTSNGLLLRADLHNLFDTGYLTVTPSYHIEVSSSIQEKFDNGKEYYQLHGNQLQVIPPNLKYQPGQAFIEWHNERMFGR